MWAFFIPLFPDEASTMAGKVDALFFYLLVVSGFFAILISLLVVVFAVRYRRAKRPKAEQIEGSLPLELTWTIIPLGLAMVMFVWGTMLYFSMHRPPRDAEEIYGIGKQWMWKFQHRGGQREINQLHVPVGRDIKVILTSQDVIHSFYVPAFRIKQDAVPGRYTTAWFRATKPGVYHLFCAEYCGTNHSAMIGQVVVMEPAQYQAWLAGGPGGESLASSGEKLFQDLACNTCHRADSMARGPDLAGIFGSQVLLQGGRTITADESYIRESILTPRAKIVSGFQPIMPTFQGQVSEEGLLQLVAYIKSLSAKTEEPSAPNPPNPSAIGVNAQQPQQEP